MIETHTYLKWILIILFGRANMLKLHTKQNIPYKADENDTSIIAIKKYFINEIKKTRTYKNYTIGYHSYDNPSTDDDKCFNKFAIGKIDNHRTENLDLSRCIRLHWIHMILDYMIQNNFVDPSGLIKLATDSNSVLKDKFNLYILYKKYGYVIALNIRKNVMIVGTALKVKEKQFEKYDRMLPVSSI
jgi:hypothetical protein